MRAKKIHYTIITFFLFLNSYCQDISNNPQIIDKLNAYFSLERENIHLHLNKKTYLSNESIWFKGYTYNRKELLPFYNTMNVFVALHDQSGAVVSKQLSYANTGTFEGVFKDLKKLPSGNYYVQVYTNWMNNFQEDESSIYPIKIINTQKPNFFDSTIPNPETAKIEVIPEGGVLLYGINNTVGIKMVDAHNNAIGNQKIYLKNASDELISEIAINNEGLGKFVLNPKNENYTLSADLNNKTIKKSIPSTTLKGVTLEVNTFSLADKASVKIKTNPETINDISKNKLFLVVHQDERALLFDVNIDAATLEQNIIFSTDAISDGINVVRIIDQYLNQLAERTFIKLPKNKENVALTKKINLNGGLELDGLSNQKDANISISIVPNNGKNTDLNSSITTDFLCNFYLNSPVKNIDNYLSNPKSGVKYELDLIMLNITKSKYSWNEIISNAPKNLYEFDMGLTIKGKVVSPILKNVKDYNVSFRSYHHQINVQSPISDEGDFEFKNLILSDSTLVDYNLQRNTDSNPIKLAHTAKVINGQRNYNHAFKGISITSNDQIANTLIEDIPVFKEESILLNSVNVKARESKDILVHKKKLSNVNLRGYKITGQESIDLLTFLDTKGFRVYNSGSNVSIISPSGGDRIAKSPEIFMDDMQIRDFSFLQNIQMNELEEIYLNPSALVSSGRNLQGTIRIYKKFKPKPWINNNSIKTVAIDNGYSDTPKFENVEYSSTNDNGFINYGVINWIPTLLTDQLNTTKAEIPNLNQKKIKVTLEGFTFDGKLISETHYIDL